MHRRETAFVVPMYYKEYVDHGVEELDVSKLPELLQLKYGDMNEAVRVFGAPAKINQLFVGFQKLLYAN